MIAFRGWKWVIVPISLLIMWFWVSHSFEPEYLKENRWPYALGTLICGVVSFVVGRVIHEGCPLAELMDQSETHTLMFLPPEYWGILLAIVSALQIFGGWNWVLRSLDLH